MGVTMAGRSDLGLDEGDATHFYMRPTSTALLQLGAQAMLIVYVEWATLFPPVGAYHVHVRGKGAWLVWLWRLFVLLPLPFRAPVALFAGISYMAALALRLARMCDGRPDFIFSRAGIASTGALFHRFLPWEEIEEIERRGLWTGGGLFSKRRLVAHRFQFRVRRDESMRLVCRVPVFVSAGSYLRRRLVINTGFDQISVSDVDAMIEKYAPERLRVSPIGE